MELRLSSFLKGVVQRNRDLFISLLVAIGYCVSCVAIIDFFNILEICPDEGYNIIKASLLNDGHRFAKDIWSDQPPLFSYTLWGLFELVGWKVGYARVFVLILSGMIIFSTYDVVRRTYSHLAALSAIMLMLSSYQWIQFSYSVMLGIPCLAFASLSFWFLMTWHDTYKTYQLALSGVLFGISVSIKAFTFFLLPIFLIGVLFKAYQRRENDRFWKLLALTSIFLGSVAIVSLLCYLPSIVSADSISSLWKAHTRAAQDTHKTESRLLVFLLRDIELYSLAAIGALFVFRKVSPVALTLLGWFAASLGVFYVHHPIWHHHMCLIAIPGSALAALPGHYLYRYLKRRGLPPRAAIALGALLSLGAVSIMLATDSRRPKNFYKTNIRDSEKRTERALTIITQHLGPKRTMITSRPMLAFHSKSHIHPFLGVTSRKRFMAGLLSADQIIQTIESWKPEQIVINKRWPKKVRKRVKKSILTRYRPVFRDKKNAKLTVYVRQDLKEAAKQ